MFDKNLHYYRLRKGVSKKQLADACGVSSASITYYEQGKRYPEDMATFEKLANALDINISDFLRSWNDELKFTHLEFRKSDGLSKKDQDLIKISIEEYFGRFFQVMDFLGGEILPESPELHNIPFSYDIEDTALKLREHLDIAKTGNVGNLVDTLENSGILIYMINLKIPDFAGINGMVNNYPYIVVNQNLRPEKIRSTLAHELCHIFINWPEELDLGDIKDLCNRIGAAFLISKKDAIRELGIKRTKITSDMEIICREYGISMYTLVKRAFSSGIISKSLENSFYSFANKQKWSVNEPSRISPEKTQLFEQLVYRAINEDEISIAKGAELLQTSYDNVLSYCQNLEAMHK